MPQFPANLVTFTEEILNGKIDFLCSANLQFFIFSTWLDQLHHGGSANQWTGFYMITAFNMKGLSKNYNFNFDLWKEISYWYVICTREEF